LGIFSHDLSVADDERLSFLIYKILVEFSERCCKLRFLIQSIVP